MVPILSIVFGIPIAAIATSNAGAVAGTISSIVYWVMIALLNIVVVVMQRH